MPLKPLFLFSDAVISSLFLTQQLISQLWPFISKIVGDILKNSIEPEIKKSLPFVIKSFHFVDVDLGNKVKSWHSCVFTVFYEVWLSGLEITGEKMERLRLRPRFVIKCLLFERKWCLNQFWSSLYQIILLLKNYFTSLKKIQIFFAENLFK